MITVCFHTKTPAVITTNMYLKARVIYEPHGLDFLTKKIEGVTHRLSISKPNCHSKKWVQLLQVDCGASNWEMWGVADDGSKILITDPNIIVDALVHCIDRTSGRDAVHDPDMENKFER